MTDTFVANRWKVWREPATTRRNHTRFAPFAIVCPQRSEGFLLKPRVVASVFPIEIEHVGLDVAQPQPLMG